MQPHIHLFGDTAENFYLLGMKDREGFHANKKRILKVSKLECLALAFNQLTISTKHIGQFYRPVKKWLESYAEGLDQDLGQLHQALIIPEFISAYSKWNPEIAQYLPGCSSFFLYDKKTNKSFHGRNLDFSLLESFDRYERLISLETKDVKNQFTLTTQGAPLPMLTNMNEHFSFATHHIYNDQFNLKGVPLYEIASGINYQATNFKEVKQLLKNVTPITKWSFYLLNKENKVLAIELNHQGHTFKEFHLRDYEYLYFDNRPLRKDQMIIGPHHFEQFCQGKASTAKKLYKKYLANKVINNKNIFKVLAGQTYRDDLGPHWNIPVNQINTLQSLIFCPSNQSVSLLPGPAPKIYQGEIIEINNIFGKKQEKLVGKIKLTKFHDGIKHLGLAQASFDHGDYHLGYHQIQLAIDKLGSCAEGQIAKFYFIVWQYLLRDNKNDCKFHLQNLEDMRGKIPEILKDHLLLFINRFQMILELNCTIKANQFESSKMQRIFEKERPLKPVALKLLKKLTFPRMEILDIVYAY